MPEPAGPVLPEPSTSSASLLLQLQADDPRAWHKLVHLYGPLVYHWARAAGLQASDAADVFQETFRAVLRHIGGFQRDGPGRSLRGWLWTITRNKVHDHFRQVRGRPQAAGGTTEQLRLAELPDDEPPSAAEPGIRGTRSTLLARALELIRGDFEPRTWQAFWRIAVDEVPTADVAAELGISVNAARLAKSRVLRRLRLELDGLE